MKNIFTFLMVFGACSVFAQVQEETKKEEPKKEQVQLKHVELKKVEHVKLKPQQLKQIKATTPVKTEKKEIKKVDAAPDRVYIRERKSL